jgi:hypothetical protein
MPLLSLADHAIFDTTDGAGVILDTRSGVYFGLNGTATIMQVVARLVARLDGSADTLRTGVESLAADLRARELLLPGATGAV